MLFQYIGDAKAPETTIVFDYYFDLRGAPVEVTNPFHIEKLKNNSSFIWDDGTQVPVLPAPVIVETFDLSEVTEAELEELTAPKKKKSK